MNKGSGLGTAVAAVCVLAAMLTGCSSRDPNVRKQKFFESGQSYYQKGKYGEAAIQFQNAIQVDNRFAAAHYQLAQADMKLQRWPDALQHLERTLEIDPNHYDAHLDIATLLLDVNPPQLKEVKDHLDLLVQKHPTAEVYVALANYNAANNDLPEALKSIAQARQMNPNRPETYLNMALLQVQAHQWDDAEASFKRVVELDPKSANSFVSLGTFYRARGRYPEAEQQYRHAIETAPNDPDPRLSLAHLFVDENKISEAEGVLVQAKKDIPNNPVAYRMLGDFYFANNQLDQALAEFGSLYREHPKDLAVKKGYIQLLILKDRLEEARKLNDEVLKAAPDDTEGLICKGQIEIRGGNASAAINTLQGALKNEPSNPVAHFQLGVAFDRAGNGGQAETEWRAAVRLRPGLSDAHRALAGAAIQRGDTTALAQEADQIIAQEPSSPIGYLLRAVADIDRKQFASAEDFINRSIAKSANNPAAYVQLGNLRMAQNRPADAQKEFQKALEQDPNSADALGGVLNVYVMQKQADKAIEVASAQLARFPQNVGFHIILGRLRFDTKNDAAGAEAEFQRAAQLDPNNTEALLRLGNVQSAAGKVDQALQTFVDAAKRNPTTVDFPFRAGNIYEHRQDWDKAKQMYQRVLEIQPDNPSASNNLAFVMLQQGGNVDMALAMAQTARRQAPDNPSFADTLGWAYYHKQIYNSAITLCQEAVKKQPENPTFIYHLGMAYAKNKQASDAQRQLGRLQKVKPGATEIEELRKALDEIKG